MCGIVGYLGKKKVVPLIVDSLRQLEYRGYDSAGVAYLEDDQSLKVYKASGKLANLENVLPEAAYQQNGGKTHLGIGHIRWATHGAPNDINAHPHLSQSGEIALVHNGIIENFQDIKNELSQKGYHFSSDTDTECVAQLLDFCYQQAKLHAKENPTQENFIDFFQVIREALTKLRGAYALAVITKSDPDKLYAVRSHAPLVIGVGQNEHLVASDVVALAEHTNKVIYLKDQEIAEISDKGVRLMTLDGETVYPIVEQITTGPLLIDKKGFKHFMLKEIHEQPDVVRNSLAGRLLGVEQPIQMLPETDAKGETLSQMLVGTRRIYVIGCGTSFHAGLVGKYFIEEMVRVPVEVEAAGEFRYRNPIIDSETTVVVISQSGETADTLEALRQSAQKGAKVIAITNREDSTMAREAHFVLPVRAGVEVSVCATKSFTAQIIVLYLLGLKMAEVRNHPDQALIQQLKTELLKVPALIESILASPEPIQAMAKEYGSARDILFIARGINFPVALEGALKLKEISYIHAEGYSGSELKHGPIAMLDRSIPVVSVLVPGIVQDKMISNCQEAKARDAQMLAFTSDPEIASMNKLFDSTMTIPQTHELLSPLLTSVPLQLLAYYMAEFLGKDVDQPRNLAKSVTVE
jgi:glucosamine--fructose-6-phosphate aminotransferase (isomerizing)